MSLLPHTGSRAHAPGLSRANRGRGDFSQPCKSASTYSTFLSCLSKNYCQNAIWVCKQRTPSCQNPIKKKNLKAHTLPEHHPVPSKPPDHKNKRDRRWLIWNESPSLQRCVLGTTNRSLPAALLCGPIPSPARQCLLGTLTSIFLATLLLDHRHQLSEVMHVFPSVRPSANCSDQKSFRSNPNILYPSCFLSCHHNYKSQGTQQRFSLTDQKATDPHISDFTNTL